LCNFQPLRLGKALHWYHYGAARAAVVAVVVSRVRFDRAVQHATEEAENVGVCWQGAIIKMQLCICIQTL
jgi:hypothetical protein